MSYAPYRFFLNRKEPLKLFTVSSILVEIMIDLESINPFHRPEIEMYIGRAV